MMAGKTKRDGDGDGGGRPQATLASHPRARSQIARAKGWGGLVGFALGALLSWRAGAAPFDIGLRALAGGIAGWLVAWRCAVSVWTHLAVAEIRAAHRRALATTAPERRGEP
jgi:hypothetical protein